MPVMIADRVRTALQTLLAWAPDGDAAKRRLVGRHRRDLHADPHRERVRADRGADRAGHQDGPAAALASACRRNATSALQLALSRSTVREALRVLAEAGLPRGAARPGRRHVRGRGAAAARGARPARRAARARVRPLGDTLVLRRVLEVGVGRAGGGARHPRRLSSGWPSWSTRRRSSTPSAYPAYRAVDSRLHVAIAAISGSLQLVEAITQAHGVDLRGHERDAALRRDARQLDRAAPSAAGGDREPRPRRRARRHARARRGHRAPALRPDPRSDEGARRALRDRLRGPARHPARRRATGSCCSRTTARSACTR